MIYDGYTNMIDPNKWYSVSEISQERLIPALETDYKIKRWIDRGYLKGNTIGKGQGKRYFIKGEKIIQFVAKWEAGDFS